jgi:flagellar assembly protein FliH
LVVRDRVPADEIRAFLQDDVEDPPTAAKAVREPGREARQFEYESLDVVELAPLLILQAAQEKAHDILVEATAEANKIRKQTLQESASEGREDAKRDILPALIALADAGQSLIVFEEQLVSRYTPQIVELALEIAEKIIAKAAEEDPEIVASVLERAKQEVVDAKQLRIWLHPADYQVLNELRPDLLKMGEEGGRTIEVMASEEIARGGCRLETESGMVDATVPIQIDEIRRQLLDEDGSNGGASAVPALNLKS